MVERDATIESISIIVLESDPAQYRADVTVVQPNSCATFGHVQARQDPGETEIELAARIVTLSRHFLDKVYAIFTVFFMKPGFHFFKV